jgi:hypothetical protein
MGQELASIMKFIQSILPDSNYYYYKIPEDFKFPAVYFPPPEIVSNGDTFLTYAKDFNWFVKFFAVKTQEAYTDADTILTAIRRVRNLIPLINEDGSTSDDGLRINDPILKIVDDGVVQLQISFTSRQPYEDSEIIYNKMQAYHLEMEGKNG